ncbi:inactivation no afterpotential E isoform X2 [Musca autumnalis]|uniref:inactivation no afterpotential E isoform X2 n=1 Tax=Musca autumnalis TaxID=221902 RepID=UPI003CEB1725
MPGLVVFRRRWSVGSDDLVVPGAFLLTIHLICLITVIASLCTFEYDTNIFDVKLLFYHQIGYVIILGASLAIEIGICIISMRGSILDSDARAPINMWIYLKTAVMLFDISWLILGSIWLSRYYLDSPVNTPKQIFFAIVISSWALVFVTCITVWCTFDTAGRSWVKMKKYQRSMRETESRFNYKRSNSMNRNWRQRKVIRAYQDSWDQRCRLLFCCMGSSEQTRNSFTDIARLLSDFFRELDVVPSDVVAGLVLLRKFQRLEREAIVRQRKNGTYEFLSGVPITERTQFLALNDVKNYEFFQTVIHYMYFAQGAYGWPMYFIINRSKVCHLVPELKCFACCTGGAAPTETEVIQDNCCYCNYAALKKTLQVGDIEIVYVTYHVDVGETPFFVAIDYTQKKIVISIRGTLSMKDILTDLNAEAEVLPLNPPRDDWLGHKGMVQAAVYIKNKLQEENIIERALNKNPERNTDSFGLVVVGHSLGAGAASILAILLKPDYPSVQCFGYAPPGGLLSMPAVEYSKSFITSVVLGKDVVPRIGLYQMEALRADLINAIQRSIDPKWKTISCSIICCGCGPEPKSVLEMSGKDTHINKYQEERGTARSTSTHPTDSSIALTLHQPLYPPGRIIHIVRHHPKADENVLKSREPVYQAIWADTTDFDEVLISPVMLQDHMPDKILAALKKVVTTSGPRKPHRQASNAFSMASNDIQRSNQDVYSCYNISNAEDIHQQQHGGDGVSQTSHHTADTRSNTTTNHTEAQMHATLTTVQQLQLLQQQQRVCLETSFTNLHSPVMIHKHAHFCESISSSKASSLAGSVLSRSQLSSIQCDISSVAENSIATVAMAAAARRSPMVSIHSNEATHSYRMEQQNATKTKQVAFEDTTPPTPASPIATVMGNLQRHSSEKGPNSASKPKSLVIPPLRRASVNDTDDANKKRTDNWGVAPLASPETLSEISSISSRNSLGTGLDRQLHEGVASDLTKNGCDNNGGMSMSPEEDIYESQLHTPKVMRRAPKFIENLSTCAEDKRNLDKYKRMGRVFISHPLFHHQPSQNSSDDDDSFESADSYKSKPQQNGERKRVEVEQNCQNLCSTETTKLEDDKVCQTTITSEVSIIQLTASGDSILYDQDDEESSCQKNTLNIMSSLDTGDYYSANSSIERVSSSNHNNIGDDDDVDADRDLKESSSLTAENYQENHTQRIATIIPPGVLESHFPLHYDAFTSTTTIATTEPYTTVTTTYPITTNNDEDQQPPQTQPQPQTVTVQSPSKMSILSSPSLLGRKRNKYCIYPSGLTTPSCIVSGGGGSGVVDARRSYNISATTATTTTTGSNLPEILVTNGTRQPSKILNESTV